MADDPFRAALSFLTVLPVGAGRGQGGGAAGAEDGSRGAAAGAEDGSRGAGAGGARPHALEQAARGMPAFPIVGMIIGAMAGAAGAGLIWAGADPLVGAFAAVAAAAILTGLHHADGLADLADGLMAGGSPRRRLAAMRDRSVGAAGASALALSYIGTVLALSLAGGAYDLLVAVVLSEAAAKFAMVLMARVARPAAPGSGAVFAAAARGPAGAWRLAAAAAAAAAPAVLLGSYAGAAMIVAAAAAALALAAVSTRAFGGITGDALGAGNEAARLAAVMAFVTV